MFSIWVGSLRKRRGCTRMSLIRWKQSNNQATARSTSRGQVTHPGDGTQVWRHGNFQATIDGKPNTPEFLLATTAIRYQAVLRNCKTCQQKRVASSDEQSAQASLRGSYLFESYEEGSIQSKFSVTSETEAVNQLVTKLTAIKIGSPSKQPVLQG